MRDPHIQPVSRPQAVERTGVLSDGGEPIGSVLRVLRSLVWKEDTPLHSQFRLAWALYFALIGFIVLLHVVTVR